MKSHYGVVVNWVKFREHTTWWARSGEQRWVNFCERQGYNGTFERVFEKYRAIQREEVGTIW